MARVTVEEVKEILDNSTLSIAVIEAFISGATAFVDKILGSDISLSSALLKEIERWITAHMISTTVERMAEKEGAGGASITYTGKYGQNLSSSPYGQMALTLDSSGKLALSGTKSATMFVVPSFSGSDFY